MSADEMESKPRLMDPSDTAVGYAEALSLLVRQQQLRIVHAEGRIEALRVALINLLDDGDEEDRRRAKALVGFYEPTGDEP